MKPDCQKSTLIPSYSVSFLSKVRGLASGDRCDLPPIIVAPQVSLISAFLFSSHDNLFGGESF